MTITVRLFAILRERIGVDQVPITVAEGATVQTVIALLIQTNPPLRDLLPRAAFAVNQEYVPSSTPLHDGDELAVIPPVSGGAP